MINLRHTLESGQVFRYFKDGDGYKVIHGKNMFMLADRLKAKGRSAEFLRMDDDYSSILKEINKDEIIGKAIAEYNGLRLLRQDPWECTVSFLCSMASNIHKIKANLNAIAEIFGGRMNGFHAFPGMGEIDNFTKLKRCGVGFRAKYIYELNDTVTNSFFNSLKRKSYEDAKQELMQLPGIGPKVADCVLLFSLDHLNSFPIDIWMERVMNENYGEQLRSYAIKPKIKHMHQFAQDYFGKHAGYAQQFLYHWKRNRS